jgi:hypothetical protein
MDVLSARAFLSLVLARAGPKEYERNAGRGSARRRERQPSGGTYGRIRCVAQLNDESERAREREREYD